MKNKKNSKIYTEKDYIESPKHDHSLKKLLQENPDGVSDKVIAKVLKISLTEMEEYYRSAIIKLRNALGEKDEV